MFLLIIFSCFFSPDIFEILIQWWNLILRRNIDYKNECFCSSWWEEMIREEKIWGEYSETGFSLASCLYFDFHGLSSPQVLSNHDLLFASENKDGTTSIPEYRIKHTHTPFSVITEWREPLPNFVVVHIYIYCIVYSPIRMGKLYPACEICGIPYKKRVQKREDQKEKKKTKKKKKKTPIHYLCILTIFFYGSFYVS